MADDQTKLAVCGNFSKLLGNGDLADFVSICDEGSWNVHRVILTLHSNVLSKSCSGGFKESHEKQIDLLGEHAPEHVDAPVDYMYTFTYVYALASDFNDTISFHINMAIIANKYDITGLHKLATANFKKLALDSATFLATAARTAYAAPAATEEIRKSPVGSVINRKGLLSQADGKPLVEVMEQMGSFAVAVVRELAFPNPLLTRNRCPFCYQYSSFGPAKLNPKQDYECWPCEKACPGKSWLY